MLIKGNKVTTNLIGNWINRTLVDQDIQTISLSQTKPVPLFYANDYNGYMGLYLKETNSLDTYQRERVTHFYIELANEIVKVPNDYEAFFHYLTENYPSEKSGLERLKSMIQQVGQEWFGFITGGLDWSKFFTLRNVLKYSEKNFLDEVEAHISDKELLNLFFMLQPYNGEIGFNTMAGYLYMQFFDMHKIPAFWEDILTNSVQSEKSQSSSEIYSFIDDSPEMKDQHFHTYYSLIFESYEWSLDSVLMSSLEVEGNLYNVIIWPLDFVQVDGKFQYKIDVAIPEHVDNFKEIYDAIQVKMDVYQKDMNVKRIIDPNDYEHMYGFKKGTGLRWALSAQQSKKMSKYMMSNKEYSHWGFAWFTAMAIFINRQKKGTQK